MNHVLANFKGEVTADGAGRCLKWVGCSNELPGGNDCLVSFKYQRHKRAGGNELNELTEEGLVLMLFVVLAGRVGVKRALLESSNAEALALEASEDFSGEAACESVWLYKDESALHVLYEPFGLMLGRSVCLCGLADCFIDSLADPAGFCLLGGGSVRALALSG